MARDTRGKQAKKRRFYRRKGFWLGGLGLLLLACLVGWVAAERFSRPYRERADTYDLDRINDIEKPSIILGRDGGEIGRVFVQNRSVVPIEEVSTNLVAALAAGEDKRFFKHDGVDYIGILRAGIDWLKEGEAVSGASTITQQLARGAYSLEAERRKREESGIERKLVEAFLAIRIEKRYSKQQILEFYLNRIYFGSGYYGIRSASLGYFGKEPADLSKLESATIVGLIKNPTRLSPLNDPKGCLRARNMVIDRMANLGQLSQAEASRLRTMPVKTDPKPLLRGTNHAYERIADEIRQLVGGEALSAGGFTIRTTIDSRVQRSAERALEASLKRAESVDGYSHPTRSDFVKQGEDDMPEYLQGAVLMVDHRNGEVIAHVGGRDYADAPFDVIELGRRPLGTAFHPFLYAAAFESGMTPASKVLDDAMDNRAVMVGGREGILGEWGMETTQPTYVQKEIPLRQALESSKVAAGVRVANEVGLAKVAETAEAFGLPMDDAELLPRLAVGWEEASLKEAVRAISVFGRNGKSAPAAMWYVESISDSRGLKVYERPRPEVRRLNPVSDATAFQIHSILQGSMRHGSAAGVLDQLIERPFNGAGKTGTTHDFSDNWFLGYNGRVACGVWVGFLQPGKSIYTGAFSRDLAMPVWVEAMNAASRDFGGKGIPRPPSIVEVEVCRVSGQQATDWCYEVVSDPETGRSRSRPAKMPEYFRRGTESLPFCPIHSGAAEVDPNIRSLGLSELAVIDTAPVIPKAPALIGADPYHCEQLTPGQAPAVSRRGGRTNVLDSFDLNEAEDQLPLPRPKRLEISPD